MMNPRCAMGMYSETTVVSFPPCGPAVEVKAPAAFPFNLPWNHRPPRLSMNAFNSADVLPNRVGVPNMIPSAHSASAGAGAPYSASILLLRSSQPGTLAITAVETISGTRRSRTSAPASRAPSLMALASASMEPSREQNATRMFALGSGIDNPLKLNVFLNSVLDPSNKHEVSKKKAPKRFSVTVFRGQLISNRKLGNLATGGGEAPMIREKG